MRLNMNAIQILIHEHEQIICMIEVTKVLLNNENSDGIDINDLEKIIDFMRNFADKYHHLKEENMLFLEMENRGMSANSGPIAVMLHEHKQGRALVKQALDAIALYKSGDLPAMNDLRQALLNYGELLTNHISKENNILYPMAERILPQNVLIEMSEKFKEFNSSTPDNEYFDFYMKLVDNFNYKYPRQNE